MMLKSKQYRTHAPEREISLRKNKAYNLILQAIGINKTPNSSISHETIQQYKSAHKPLYQEYDYWIDQSLITGALPPDLVGTFLRVAPALTEAYGTSVRALEDADGMVTSIAIRNGQIFFRNRYVRTRTFSMEQVAGVRLSRGFYDALPLADFSTWTMASGLDPTSFRNAANASLVAWGGRLHVLSEAGPAHELHRVTLETLGESNWGGLLAGVRVAKDVEGDDGQTGRVALMGVSQSGADCWVEMVELDAQGRELLRSTSRLSECVARCICDFAITPEHYIVFQPPVSLNMGRLMTDLPLGDCSAAECLEWDNSRGTLVHVLPRPKPKTGKQKGDSAASVQHSVIQGPSFHVLSVANAYSVLTPNGPAIIVHAVVQRELGSSYLWGRDTPDKWRQGPKPELCQIYIDVGSSEVSIVPLSRRTCVPAAAVAVKQGRPHMYLYTAASAIEDPVQKGAPQVLMKTRVPLYTPESVASSSRQLPQTTAQAASQSQVLSTSRSLPGYRHRIEPPTQASLVPAMRVSGWGVGSEVWSPGDEYLLETPVFVARKQSPAAASAAAAAFESDKNEDAGWIVLMAHDTHLKRSILVILDAQHPQHGPVAAVSLPHHLPPATSSVFIPTFLGPGRTAPEDWRSTQR